MKYRHKVKIEQKTTKIKGQKRRVAEHGPWEGKYTDEEIASMVDYDYDYLLDTIYYKMERMVAFFNSKHTHIAGAKKVAKQIEVALRLLNIIRGKSVTYDEKELEKIVNTRNKSRFKGYTLYGLRKEKAWHVFFLYLEHRMRNWWD
jgi:hypothetical protein